MKPLGSPASSALRLIWSLAAVATVAFIVAAVAWTQTRDDGPIPVSIEDLTAGELAAADPAPGFSVPTLDGATFSLEAHLEEEGTPVLLNLWASWCPPCRAEMPALDAAASRYPGVKFVGVAVQDDLEAARRFATEVGVGYTLGFDERDVVNALYPSFGLPVSYLISAQGTILQPVFGELDEADIDALLSSHFGG